MTFVSYAQNNEDVMLARVFRGLDAGFYIDVGAQDPRIDSVTKLFYDRGWRGINMEPVEAWYQKLCQDRPRDVNLRLAAGAREGVVDFYEIADTGLSTSSAEFAQRHEAQGHDSIARKVQVRTLDAICAEHGVEVVHFLKIDAEGDEADVLRGIDLVSTRPWVILVESTEPNSPVSTHARWESLLTDRGYGFVYSDGLNRFYLASEHATRGDAFATPPSVLDGFVHRRLVDQLEHEKGLARHIAAVEELAQLRAETIERFGQMVAEKDDILSGSLASRAEAEANLSRLREVLTERESSLSALQGELAERDSRYSVLQGVVAERESSLSVLHGELAERDASLSVLQGELAERVSSYLALQAELSGREASLSMLRAVIAGHEIELQVRKANIEALAARLQGSEQTVATLARTLVDAHAARMVSEEGWRAALAAHRATLGELARAQGDFQEIISSRSWRLTSPLRRIMTRAIAARGDCLRAGRRLASKAWLQRLTAFAPKWLPGIADRAKADGPALAAPAARALPTLPPRALPISEDAEQILSWCPIVEPARTREGAM